MFVPTDPEAEFRRLFETYFGPVCAYFRRLGVREDLASDLAQETFLRVYRSLSWFRGEASHRTWIYHIAKNVWCNELRRRNAEKREGREVSLHKITEQGPALSDDLRLEGWEERRGALEAVLAEERRAKLLAALHELPKRMRQCVLLRLHHDLKYREIAVVMKISIQTVKSQLSQAQERLSRELGPYFDPLNVRGDGD
jgi:RNA polymerase sigma-70 factor (ECF subfamily)